MHNKHLITINFIAKVVAAYLSIHTLLFSSTGFSQSLESGMKKYRVGDLVDAEDDFRAAAAKATGRKKATILKMLGICQYMLGDMSSSKKNFKTALKLNPSLQISPKDVLDESVLPFFNSLKQTTVNKKADSKPVIPKTIVKKQAKAIAKKASTTPKPSPKKNAKPPVIEKTTIKVLANIKDAGVMAGGIPIGRVNENIDIQPGFINISVLANGYDTVNKNMTIIANRTNYLRVTLHKAPPQQNITPQLSNQKEDKIPTNIDIKPQTSFGVDDNAVALVKPPKELKGDAGSKERLEQNQARSRALAEAKAKSQDGTVRAKDVLNAKREEKKRNLKNHQQRLKQKGKAKKKESKFEHRDNIESIVPNKNEKKSLIVSLLPFGAGQFQNNSYILGSTFALLEVGAIYYFLDSSKKADQEVDATNSEIDKRLLEESTLSGDDKVNYQKETEDYATQAEDEINSLRQQAQIGIAAFAGLWVIGALEAVLNTPKYEAAKPTKKRRKRRPSRPRKQSSNLQMSEQEDFLVGSQKPENTYKIEIRPAYNYFLPSHRANSLVFNLKSEF
ncbi:MAG: hypothetical protein R3B45_15750 [Bdellovibrionota bacterium]